MKKILFPKFLLLFFLILSQFVNSQTQDKVFALSIGYIKNEYVGDYGSDILNFFVKKPYSGIGVNINYFISSSINLGIQTSMGNYGYIEDIANAFSCKKFDAAFTTQYKFANGRLLSEYSKLNPYLSIGLGFADYKKSSNATPWPTYISKVIDIIIPIGLGLKYQLSDRFAVQYQYLYTLTSSDVHDQNRSGGEINTVFGTPLHPGIKVGNDAYGQHFFSLTYLFSKPWDKDNDRIPDRYQKNNN